MKLRLLMVAGCSLVLTTFSLRSQIVEVAPVYGAQPLFKSERLLRDQLLYEAGSLLRAVERDFPESPAAERVPYVQAEALARSGEYANADAVLYSFIVSRPNSPFVAYAQYRRATLAFEQEKYPQARELFEAAVQRAAEDATVRGDSAYTRLAAAALYWTGMSYAHEGKYEEARQPLIDNTTRYPGNPHADDALYTLGQLADNTMDNEQAIEYFQRIIKEYPYSNTRLAAHIRLAQNHIVMRQYTTALAELEAAETVRQSIQRDGEVSRYEQQSYSANIDEEVLYLRGEAHNGGERFSQALETFRSLLAVYPQSSLRNRALLGAGWASLNMQQYEQAIAYYDSVLVNNSSSNDAQAASARFYRLIAMKHSNKRDEAKQGLLGLSVLPGYPLIGEALLELGQMYYEDQQMVEAQRALERAERETTSGLTRVRILVLLGEVLLENGLYDKAESVLTRAEEVVEKSSPRFVPNKSVYLAEARLKRGIALAGSSRYSEAIDALRSFMAEHYTDKRMDVAVYWLAESFYQSVLMQNAVEYYNRIIRDYPASTHREAALYGLGWAEFRMKNFTKSAATFAQLLREYPNTEHAIDVLIRKGDGHYLSKQYPAAADAYRQAARRAPDTDQGLYASYQLSQALYRQNSYDEAVSAAQDFLRRYPGSIYADNAAYTVGWIRFRQNRFNEAIDDFEKVLAKYPKTQFAPRILYAVGDCYYNLGNYEQAIVAYQRVIDEYPNSADAFNAVTAIQYSLVLLGREDDSVLFADRIIAANPGTDVAEQLEGRQGDLFLNSGRYEDAITGYKKFLDKYPSSKRKAEVLFDMAKSYEGIARRDKSLADAQKAGDLYSMLIKDFPDTEQAELAEIELAMVYVFLNEPDKAQAQLENARKKYPDKEIAVRASFEQAYLRQMRGDTLGAVQGYRAVADKYRGTEYGDRSRYWIAMHYRSLDQYDSARTEMAQIATRQDALGAEAQYRIGELWLRDKNFEKARAAFEVSKEKFSEYEDWNTLALIGLGEAYEQLSQLEAAKETYRLVIALRGEDDFAKTAQARLDRLSKTEKP